MVTFPILSRWPRAAWPTTLILPMAIALSLAVSERVGADTLLATDAGFVTEAGGSAKGDGTLVFSATNNYSVGRELHYDMGAFGPTLVPMDRNNYFVFDLTDVSEPIVSASLEVYAGILESVDPTETFDLVAPMDLGAALADTGFLFDSNLIGSSEFDEPSDPAIMIAAALYGNLAGDPTSLGSVVISSADDETVLTIPLTSAGVDYLNSFLGGPVVLGGSVPTAVPPGSPQQPFGLTGPDIPGGDPLTPALELILIPEPATMASAALGLLGMVTLRRRRRA